MFYRPRPPFAELFAKPNDSALNPFLPSREFVYLSQSFALRSFSLRCFSNAHAAAFLSFRIIFLLTPADTSMSSPKRFRNSALNHLCPNFFLEIVKCASIASSDLCPRLTPKSRSVSPSVDSSSSILAHFSSISNGVNPVDGPNRLVV